MPCRRARGSSRDSALASGSPPRRRLTAAGASSRVEVPASSKIPLLKSRDRLVKRRCGRKEIRVRSDFRSGDVARGIPSRPTSASPRGDVRFAKEGRRSQGHTGRGRETQAPLPHIGAAHRPCQGALPPLSSCIPGPHPSSQAQLTPHFCQGPHLTPAACTSLHTPIRLAVSFMTLALPTHYLYYYLPKTFFIRMP